MKRGDSTRLFLLAELARRRQAHGHELRREAKVGRTELWTDVGVGAIYATLKRMSVEGLVDPVRTERPGLLPERTIYTLTNEGHRELRVLRDQFLRTVELAPDAFDLGLSVADDVPAADLVAIINDRIATLHGRVEQLKHRQAAEHEYLGDRDRDLFEHSLTRLHAEISWHFAVRNRITRPDMNTNPEESP